MQILYDFLFEYIDYSLREIGVGDLSVGKKVKTLARIFSYRMTTYDKSIILGFNNIKKPIKKFVFKDKVKKNDLDNFYKYINMQDNKLNSLKSEKIFTVKNLEIIKMGDSDNILFLNGSIPGSKDSIVYISKVLWR